MKKVNKQYGYFGWQEFIANRLDLLTEYDISLQKNKNRPVRTSHGNAGEAVIRKWLSEFLPQKYGVTSGYVIPDIICGEYKLYHYDIIIYDKLNSPVLWIDSNYDDAEQGKKRAIPAKYVFLILEIKSTFTNKSIKEGINKLCELNDLSNYLPKKFSSGIIFFEIKNGVLKNTKMLSNFLTKKPYNFFGGMIIRSEINSKMTGIINLNYHEKEIENIKLPLAKDIDTIDIYRTEDNSISIGEGGGGVRIFASAYDKKYHFGKTYGSQWVIGNEGVSLSWSYNHFTEFIINLLRLLEGKSITSKDNKTVFGQVFDIIEKKNGNE